MINEFKGRYYFLSNFYNAPVTYEGLTYQNNEAAFQSAKVLSKQERSLFTDLDPSSAKKMGRAVTLRRDWEEVKTQVMYEICKAKFTQNEDLRRKLLNTGTRNLEEGNTWNDRIWGTVDGVGENRLGKILMRIRKELRTSDVKDKIVVWIREWFEANGKDCNAVIGISGGIDSSVVAALCVEALGKERVIGVKMPCSKQIDYSNPDIVAADMLLSHLGIRNYTMNIWDAVIGIDKQMPSNIEISKQTTINLPPRIRMATLYALSQSVNGRVVNTCNLSEDWIGWNTRYGDSVGDLAPLASLTKTEVKEIGRILGLPDELVNKVPIDGLCGKTDEEAFGFSYDVLDHYILTGEIEDEEVRIKIDTMHEKNLFKLHLMPCFVL